MTVLSAGPYNPIALRTISSLVSVAVCTALLAACGSSNKPDAGSGHRSQFLAFSECMRSHGVTNFPDPSSSGGIHFSPSSGINPFSPSLRTAQAKCSKLLPGGGPGNQKPTERDKQAMLQISQCMRAHGVAGFPDPTLTPPSGPAGYGEVIDRGGVILAVPSTINVQSPAYKRAATACGFH